MVSFLLHGCRLQDWSRWLPNSLISETGMITLILGPGETLKQHQEAAWQQVSSPEATAGLRTGHHNSTRRRPGSGRPAQTPPPAWGWALHTWTRWLGSRKIRARGRLETESTEARGTSRRQQSVPPWLFHSHSDGLLLPISADLGCFLHPSDPLQAPWESYIYFSSSGWDPLCGPC